MINDMMYLPSIGEARSGFQLGHVFDSGVVPMSAASSSAPFAVSCAVVVVVFFVFLYGGHHCLEKRLDLAPNACRLGFSSLPRALLDNNDSSRGCHFLSIIIVIVITSLNFTADDWRTADSSLQARM